MRSLIISIVLFLVLLSLTVINVGFIRGSAEYITECAERMADPSGREDILSELEDFWSRKHDIIGLTVPYTQLDHLSEVLVCVRCAHEAGDENEFQKYRALLVDAAEGISRTERFSIGNIL